MDLLHSRMIDSFPNSFIEARFQGRVLHCYLCSYPVPRYFWRMHNKYFGAEVRTVSFKHRLHVIWAKKAALSRMYYLNSKVWVCGLWIGRTQTELLRIARILFGICTRVKKNGGRVVCWQVECATSTQKTVVPSDFFRVYREWETIRNYRNW